jgi:PHD/YefM family antitoxin component YafN of YafNO toxin-antitoxin module
MTGAEPGLGLAHSPDRDNFEFHATFMLGADAMPDLNRDIRSLSNSKRNAPEFLRELKETGHPVVLTINGKAELVVQDSASYQKLIELAERVEHLEALRESVEEMKAGKGIPAEEVLAEMRHILAGKQKVR